MILEIANDLWRDCRIDADGVGRDPEWERKYARNRRETGGDLMRDYIGEFSRLYGVRKGKNADEQ